jgi:uncharacterized protein (TIGR02246 family)
MRYWIATIAVVALGLGTAAVAQDEDAVNAIATQWAEAWNAGDMDTVGALYTEDSDYVDAFGEAVKGKAEIQAGLTEMHSTVYEGTKLSVETTAVQFVKPDVAISDTVWEFTDVPTVEGVSAPAKGQSTVVLVKEGEAWKIAVHRTRIPVAPPEE